MNVRVLVVSQDGEVGFKWAASLGLSQMRVDVVDQAAQAIKNVKRKDYDIIILDDRLKGGDTYDVGLELKTGKKNKAVPVVCVGTNKGRSAKLMNLLGRYAVHGSLEHFDTAISKVKAYLETKANRV